MVIIHLCILCLAYLNELYVNAVNLSHIAWDWFTKVTPNPDFLNNIIAFAIAIVAIAFPLISNVISKSIEQYKSKVLSNFFIRQSHIMFFSKCLLIFIVFSVLFQFLIDSQHYKNLYLVISYLILLVFIISAYSFYKYIITTFIKHLVDNESLVDDLFKKAEDCLENLKEQKIFLSAIEGIGDILVYDSKNFFDMTLIEKNLSRLTEISNKFLVKKSEESESYYKFLISQEHEHYDEWKKHCGFLSPAYLFEQYAITLPSVINQFIRVFKISVEFQNKEIALKAFANLKQFLEKSLLVENNEDIVGFILTKIYEMNRYALTNDSATAYLTDCYYYIYSVFNDNFKLPYLNLFNDNFYKTMKVVIDNDKFEVFKNVVGTLHDGILILHSAPDRSLDNALIDGQDEYKKYHPKIEALKNQASEIKEIEDLNKWKNEYEKFKNNIIKTEINKDQEKINKALDKFFEYAKYRYKYNSLQKVVFDICAYCLLRNKPVYIRELWYFKQPERSRRTWMGIDILSPSPYSPRSLDGLIKLYLNGLIKWNLNKIKFIEGHDEYYEELFLIFIILFAKNIKKQGQDEYSDLNHLDPQNLFSLQGSIEKLEKNQENLNNRDEKFFRELGIENKNECLEKIKYFLGRLKVKLKKKLLQTKANAIANFKLSDNENKINDFRNTFFEEYENLNGLKSLFKYYQLYSSSLDKRPFDENFGQRLLIEKNTFLSFNGEDVNIAIAPIEFAEAWMRGEDENIYIDIMNCCKNELHLEPVLEMIKNPENQFLLIRNIRSLSFKEQFGDNDYNDENHLYFDKKKIDLFPVYDDSNLKQVLVLNKSKLGQIIQYSPKPKTDDSKTDELDKYVKEEFFIRIKAYSEDEKLMNDTLEDKKSMNDTLSNTSENLKKQGDEEAQSKHVLLEIYERFKFERADDFEGYVIDL